MPNDYQSYTFHNPGHAYVHNPSPQRGMLSKRLTFFNNLFDATLCDATSPVNTFRPAADFYLTNNLRKLISRNDIATQKLIFRSKRASRVLSIK